MTPLRQRMLDDMQLRGFSPSTQRCYVQAVQRFAQHVGKSPDQITEEELRQYFLYLHTEKQVARSTATIALCAIKFFYEQTAQRTWPTLALIRPPKAHKLPVKLTRFRGQVMIGEKGVHDAEVTPALPAGVPPAHP